MAKKSKKTAVNALSGNRLLMKQLMHYKFDMASPASIWTTEKNGYSNNSTGTGANRFIFAETYFDLSGYEREHLTLFPQRISVQESGSFRLKEDNGSLEKGAIVLDIITEEGLTEAELQHFANEVSIREVCPSFGEGVLEFQQVIFGRYRMMAQDNSIWTPTQGNLTTIHETQWGSGSPTTCAKLWIYRLIIPLGQLLADTDDFLVVPACRYIMSAEIREESDLSFMMRQKRSYELST